MRRPARRTVIRTLLALLSLTPIVALELTLRAIGFGEAPADAPLSATDHDPLVDLHSLRPLFVKNDETQRWEVPRQRWNYFCPASFPVTKQRDAFRIFALGGSTTQGQPYLPDTAFPKWLELRLQAAVPSKPIEVINVGGISYASYRIAAILHEVLQFEPDLIVIYMGHNEFLEARTYDKQLSVPSVAVPALHWLGRLKAVQFVNQWMHRREGDSSSVRTVMPTEVDTILDHPTGMNRYVRDASWKQCVEQHFMQTLDAMLTSCQIQNVPVVLCVPVCDWVDTPPFKSEPSETVTSDQQKLIQQWTQQIIRIECTPAERQNLATQILRVDDGYALAHFVLGRMAYDNDHSMLDLAKTHLRQAIDNDVCPLRATLPIEQAIRQQENRDQVLLVDVPELFDQTNARGQLEPDGVPDPDWFVDHVHPIISGHQAIGNAIYSQLVANHRVLPEPGCEQRYETLASQHMSTLGEEYYARAAQRLQGVKRWSRQLPAFEPVSPDSEPGMGTR